MTSRVSHTTFDCLDAFALSTWWKQVLDYSDIVGDPNEPGDEECMIADRASGHQLLFIEVPDDKLVKNRVHLDLVPTDRRRDAEVDRVLALGASQVADLRQPRWIGMGHPRRSRGQRVLHRAQRQGTSDGCRLSRSLASSEPSND